MCEPAQFDSPVAVGQAHAEKATVGEGETCNPSLPPGYATSCADGLYCNSQDEPGVAGICVTCTPEACEPPQFDGIEGNAIGQVHPENGGVVGEGESCNPGLPPAYATFCAEGLYCDSGLPDSAVLLGAAGTCAKCTPEKCEPAQLTSTASTGTAASAEDPQDGPLSEGDACNPSLPPAYARFCDQGLFCSSALLGEPGTCTRCTPEMCEPAQFDSPVVVGQVHPEKATAGEGETCNPSLPPGYATSCADGLYCNSASQDGTARPGVSGICVACTPEACEPPQFDGIEGNAIGQVHSEEAGVVGEGESCNPSLPPAFATVCAEGLYCDSSLPDSAVLLGAAGTCAKCTPEKCEPLQMTATGEEPAGEQSHPEKAAADEGEVCNPSLSPTHAILCRDGLYCSPGKMRGGHGICRICTAEECGGSP